MQDAPRRPHLAVRAVAGVTAAGVAIAFVALQPFAWAGLGCDLTAVASALVAIPLVAFYTILAGAPELLARPLARWTRVDLADPAQAIALVLMAGVLFFVLGLGGLVSATATLETAAFARCQLPAASTGAALGQDVVTGVAINFAIFTLPALYYVAFVHRRSFVGTLDALGLRLQGAPRAAAIGAGVAVVFLVVLVALELAVSRVIPEEYLQNPRALDIARTLTPLGALVLAAAAGVGEEVFFRGFLQPRFGMLATAGVFALAHVSYASISEVVVVFALALVLGELYRRTGNLAAPIAMHFVFDLLQLLAGVYSAP